MVNAHRIGLGALGVVCLIIILKTARHFSPLLNDNDLHQSPFFKKLTEPLIAGTVSKHIDQRHLCFSPLYFWDKDDRPYALELTTLPSVMPKTHTSVIQHKRISIDENQITAIDEQSNIITPAVIDELIRRTEPFERISDSYETMYQFYQNACIPVRYMKYHERYYLYTTDITTQSPTK